MSKAGDQSTFGARVDRLDVGSSRLASPRRRSALVSDPLYRDSGRSFGVGSDSWQWPFNVMMIVARRPATSEDYEFLRMVHHAAFREVVERQFGPWDEAFQDEAFDREWRGAATEVVEWQGRRCGYVLVEDRDQDLHVRQLAIHPHDQNKGIGSAVLQEVTAVAESRNVPVHLGVFVASRAVALYMRLGFEEVGRSASHVIMRWTPGRRAHL